MAELASLAGGKSKLPDMMDKGRESSEELGDDDGGKKGSDGLSHSRKINMAAVDSDSVVWRMVGVGGCWQSG
jgi:hypothetical protein